MSTKSATTTRVVATTPAGAQPTPVYNIPGVPAAGNGTIFNLPTGTSPFTYPALPSGASGPNSPNYQQGQTPSSSTSNSNIPMIVGVTVAAVVVLTVFGLVLQRYRARSRTNTINSYQSRSRNKNNQPNPSSSSAGHMSDEDRGDKAKLAKSFTIRKPPSVYVDDDQDLDQTGHPRYKSASDALNHPYYGVNDRPTPGLVEYELSDTSGQKYGPSSVAERKRYVEQQQRKVMDEYEMFNPHKDPPPASPYPASPYPGSPYPASNFTSAPSYTSGPISPTMAPSLTPSMGGRSPRVHHQHPSQSPTPYGRSMQQQMDNDYQY
ncbi:hypothetical protein BGZ54_003827 [Gamsiella multidivaricata]|nr:hypothetical protein BGZ54_003827 [Gamsiella multidivaricata]